MIHAQFIANGATIPVYLPCKTLRDLAKMAGWDISDLCKVTDRAGASRYLEARLLVSKDNIAALYAAAPQMVTLQWWTEGTTIQNCLVHLMPPQPVFCSPDAPGVVLIIARDVRYLQHFYNGLAPLTDGGGETFGSSLTQKTTWDARWFTKSGKNASVDFATYRAGLISRVSHGLVTVNDAGTYDPALDHRFRNMSFSYACSPGLMLDTILVGTGNILQRNASGVYGIGAMVSGSAIPFGTDVGVAESAVFGGSQSIGATSGASSLQQMWTNWTNLAAGTGDATQYMRLPAHVSFMHPLRTVEGLTAYNAQSQDSTDPGATFPYDRTTETVARFRNSVVTGLTRVTTPTTISAFMQESAPVALRELAGSVAYPAPRNPEFIDPNPANAGWDVDAFLNAATSIYANRRNLSTGKIVFGGWVDITGGFGLTSTTWTVGELNGELAPFTVAENSDDDWILGPNGKLATDPRDVILDGGTTYAKRLWNGMLQVESAPPYTRVFLAEIQAAELIDPEGNPWQWKYEWVEREPTVTQDPPAATNDYARNHNSGGDAINMVEWNHYYAGPGNPTNTIAPGVSQLDYPNATVEAVAISPGTLVMMCEQATTWQSDEESFGVRYWFSMPNAIRVVCEPEEPA